MSPSWTPPRRLRATAPATAGAVLALLLGCEPRAIAPREPVHADVAPFLESACAACHGPERAEAGYRVDGYLRVIACTEGGGLAVEPPTDEAPLLAVLERQDHADLLSEAQRGLVLAWLEAGAPARVGSAHPAGWIDPRSPDFHATALRAERWERVLDPSAPGACARCHEGAADDGGLGAPRATPCTSCHAEPEGPLGCATCHGDRGRAFPPRDPCFFPSEREHGGAHAAHVGAGIECAVCHGARAIDQLRDGPHGDGVIQVALDPTRAGAGASWDPAGQSCATSCHDRGGATPSPAWNGAVALTCGSCHASPPAEHYAGPCNACHVEAAPDGRSLSRGSLHANGRVDLGDGSGGCGACHGAGDDPTPPTGAHRAHMEPASSAPLTCADCHRVPSAVHDEGHFDDTVGAEVRFGALASARGATPSFAEGGCANVACHGDGLGGGAHVAPRWEATDGRAARCGACHGLPPPAPHAALDGCSAVGCHGGITGPGPRITETGRALHVNGRVDTWPAE